MKSEDTGPGSADDWLRRARSNMKRATFEVKEGTLYEDFCFDAQQAAEKALKAVFVALGLDFPFTHNLARLIEVLEENDITVISDVRNASKLSEYAVTARYPGFEEPVTEAEHRQAVAAAEKVIAWAEGIIAAES